MLGIGTLAVAAGIGALAIQKLEMGAPANESDSWMGARTRTQTCKQAVRRQVFRARELQRLM